MTSFKIRSRVLSMLGGKVEMRAWMLSYANLTKS